MSNYLIIDTSVGTALYVASADGAPCVEHVTPSKGANTSMLILPSVDKVLREAGIAVGDLDVVAVAVGPGSFTGLRIGVSFANALLTAGVRLLGVNLLDMLAEGEPEGTVAALPSRAGYAYTNCGEMSVADVAAAPLSIGVADTGARLVLDRGAYAARLVQYVERHLCDAADVPVVPLYLKKSQAERLREGDHHD